MNNDENELPEIKDASEQAEERQKARPYTNKKNAVAREGFAARYAQLKAKENQEQPIQQEIFEDKAQTGGPRHSWGD